MRRNNRKRPRGRDSQSHGRPQPVTKAQVERTTMSLSPSTFLGGLIVVAVIAVVIAFSLIYTEAAKIAVIVGAVLLALGVLAMWGGWVWDVVYPRIAVFLADKAILRSRQLLRLTPDEHGFGGVVVDVGRNEYRDLDTGEHWKAGEASPPADPYRLEMVGKQRVVAALTGADIRQSVTGLVEGTDQIPVVEVAGLGNAGPWLELEQGAADGAQTIQGEIVNV